MSNKCKLICMSFDGEYVTELPRNVDSFESVQEAWEWADDMGSRWFFYPFSFVVTESGETIKDTPNGLEFLRGKQVDTIVKLFETVCKLPQTQNADPVRYAFMLETYFLTYN
jgi:hypothetical protein